VLLALAATPGRLPAATATRLAQGADPVALLRANSPAPEQVAAHLEALGVRFVLPGDPGWPFVAVAPDPPCAWLFVAGAELPPVERSVALVGGRRASRLRQAAARSLAAGLARAGWCVVSGGAVGIDAAAHDGALDGGGRTVVVLGCGHDVPYPRANVALFRRVRAAGGSVVSEHPPGTPPLAANFLPRNRLIATLGSAVVVIAANRDSGSLSTARVAGSRGGGLVLAVPGAPWDPGAAGCNDLIRDGATLVRGLGDVLEALRLATPASGATADAAAGTVRPAVAEPHRAGVGLPRRPWPAEASAASRLVLEALLEGGSRHEPRLAAEVGLEPSAVRAALLELELSGFARRSAAGTEVLALPSP
jgi:DNA processing protein